MQVFLIGMFQVTVVFKENYKQCNQRHACHKRTGKCVPAIHGAVPVGINTHQP